MGFFTTRERSELGKSAEMREQGQVRELVRHDFAPRRRPAEQDLSGHDLSGHVGSLVKRVTLRSVQDIDELIARLQRRREQLLSESARMQREIIEYAKMSQSTMQSTRIISESLAHFNKVPDAPRMSEFHVADVAEEELRDGEPNTDVEQDDSAAEAFAPDGEDVGPADDQPEATAVRRDGRSET